MIIKMTGLLIALLFGCILKESVKHENTFDKKFGEQPEMVWNEELSCEVPKYPEREFRRQDEDMANTITVVFSFILMMYGVYLVFK